MSWLKMIKAGSVQSYCWPQSWEANVSNFLSLKDLFPNIWDHDHLLTGCCKYNFEVSTSESWMSRYVFFSSAVFLIQGLNLYVLTTTKKKKPTNFILTFYLKKSLYSSPWSPRGFWGCQQSSKPQSQVVNY